VAGTVLGTSVLQYPPLVTSVLDSSTITIGTVRIRILNSERLDALLACAVRRCDFEKRKRKNASNHYMMQRAVSCLW
jgi:hypothetical protein